MVPKIATAAALFAAVSCAGCATFSRDASRSFERAYHESRPPSRPLPIWADWPAIEAAKLQDLYAEDSVTAVKNSLAHARTDAILGWEVCVTPPESKSPTTEQKAATATFLKCVEPYVRYQNVGMMLSEMHCGAFLSALARAEGHQDFARETTSELGTAASAVMGLFKNATGVTSAVTTTFGLVENSFKNYEEAYLPDERVRSGLGVFQRARLELLSQYQADPPASLAIAEYRINYYASSCSIDWMRRLIDASVSKANEDGGTSKLVVQMGGVLPPKEVPVVVGDGGTK